MLQNYYVSADGDDRANGSVDTPWKNLTTAIAHVRARRDAGLISGEVVIHLGGGRYELKTPMHFSPADSALTIKAMDGEKPVICGSKRLSGFKPAQLNGKTVWSTTIESVKNGSWYFRSLFVDGKRAPRPRLPKITEPEGADDRGADAMFRMEAAGNVIVNEKGKARAPLRDGSNTFTAKAGDIEAWHNITDVDVCVLHFWGDQRMPIKTFDPATRVVTSTHRSVYCLTDEWSGEFALYYVDNVMEALTEPGEWYLDRHAGTLYYMPKDGEDPETTEICAPVVQQLVHCTGTQTNPITSLKFAGITFEQTDWRLVGKYHVEGTATIDTFPAASTGQTANGIPGVVTFEHARDCAMHSCTIRNIGFTGVNVAMNCERIAITQCHIHEVGGCGVRVAGANSGQPRELVTSHITIADNHIHHVGRIHHAAAIIVVKDAHHVNILHNECHDGYQMGLAIGWVWGYAESVCRNNRIEKNHIHNLGHRWLSDIGCIYLLGVQPGTIVRGNVVHGTRARNYGSWGIYPDEGSSHLLIENNIAYDTTEPPLNQHYGRENVIRNNIFAFGGDGVVGLGRSGLEVSLALYRNILLLNKTPIYVAGYGVDYKKPPTLMSDLNIIWDISGEAPQATKDITMDEWHALGYDLSSVVADPMFEDAAKRDFRLKPDSPAIKLGFVPIDTSDVGPRYPLPE